MKKILYYLPTFPVLSQNFITREIEALTKSGNVDITVLSLQEGKKGRVPDVLKGKVIYFTRPKYLRALDGALFALAHPLKVLRLAIKYQDRLLTFGTAISMLSVVSRIEPVLIHANWITDGALMANILSDLTDIPFSVECHAEDIWLSRGAMLEKRVRDAKLVITCTKNNVSYLQSVLPSELWGKITPIYHFIDPNLFGGDVSSVDHPVPLIYLVGRMVEKKGFSYMIKASKILKDKGLNFKVRFAGEDGPEKSALVSLVRELSLSDVVEFSSDVSFEEHSHNFLESDIFVAPSVTGKDGNLDGIPNVVIEAMLAGLPVVATRVSAIPEVVEDGITGFLVNEKNEQELADKIEGLIKDLEKRKNFGNNGKEKILKMFSHENTIKKIEDLLV